VDVDDPSVLKNNEPLGAVTDPLGLPEPDLICAKSCTIITPKSVMRLVFTVEVLIFDDVPVKTIHAIETEPEPETAFVLLELILQTLIFKPWLTTIDVAEDEVNVH
jgi:hypothetical protein